MTKVKGNINHPRKEAGNPFIDVFSKVLWWNSKEETSMKKPRSEKEKAREFGEKRCVLSKVQHDIKILERKSFKNETNQ